MFKYLMYKVDSVKVSLKQKEKNPIFFINIHRGNK